MLFTELEDIKSLLGMNWLREFNCTIRRIEKSTTPTNQSERDEGSTQLGKLFKTKQTIKNSGIKVQLRPGHIPIKQKNRPIPHNLQSCVEKKTQIS